MSWLALWGFLGCTEELHTTKINHHDAAYREEGPDVILIVLDTLRADHLAQYGYDLATSPGLAGLAAVSTRFDHAWAPSPWTLPSTTSILTGLHPLRTGMRHPGDVLPAALHTLAEQLRTAGWRTRGYSHNVSVGPRHGFDQGFDAFTTNTGKVLGYPMARRMTSAAGVWLAAHEAGANFLYLQPMNCHGPYKVPSSRADALLGRKPTASFKYYGRSMRRILKEHDLSARQHLSEKYLKSAKEQYDTAIRYTTDEVGEMLDGLRASGRFDQALIVLTADHGEELFEHGGFSHGYSLHSEVLHVPLFVKLPGQSEARVVADPVRLLDITPTILDAVEVAAQTPLDGRSLLPLMRGEALPPEPIVHDVFWPKRIVGKALLEGGWKVVEIEQNYEGLRDVQRLYNLDLDPGELQDLSSLEPDRGAAMHDRLVTLAAALAGQTLPENVLSEEDKRQLEALGYLE